MLLLPARPLTLAYGQALTDPEPSVMADALRCITLSAPHLRKRSLLTAASKAAPLSQNPGSCAVRYAALAFISAAAGVLPAADVYTQLVTLLAPYLRSQPATLQDQVGGLGGHIL